MGLATCACRYKPGHGVRVRAGDTGLRRAAHGGGGAVRRRAKNGALDRGPLGGGRAAVGPHRRGLDRPRRRDGLRADRAGAGPHPVLGRHVRRARAAGEALGSDRRARSRSRCRSPCCCWRWPPRGCSRSSSWAEAFLLGAVLSPDRPGRYLEQSSPLRGSRASSVTRSTWSQGSTTAWRCPSSSSSSSSPRQAATPAARALKLLGEAAVGAAIGAALGVAGGRLHGSPAGRRDHRALRGDLLGRPRPGGLRARRGHLRQRPDRGLRRRHRARRHRARGPRRLHRVRRERQHDRLGAHLLRLRRADRRHRLRPRDLAPARLHPLRLSWSPVPRRCCCPSWRAPDSPGR